MSLVPVAGTELEQKSLIGRKVTILGLPRYQQIYQQFFLLPCFSLSELRLNDEKLLTETSVFVNLEKTQFREMIA